MGEYYLNKIAPYFRLRKQITFVLLNQIFTTENVGKTIMTTFGLKMLRQHLAIIIRLQISTAIIVVNTYLSYHISVLRNQMMFNR